MLASTAPALSQPGSGHPSWLIPPVDGSISRRFEAPESDYGAGHRGIDYEVLQGAAVRAAGAGTVRFAGPVGGAHAVTVAHGDGLETTYSMLSAVYVHEGQAVGQGAWLGRTGRSHPHADGGLHFAVKVYGRYVDPLDYLGALDATEAIHLAPIPDQETVSGSLQAAFEGAGIKVAPCLDVADAGTIPSSPPNDNVAVVIAGISSKTKGGPNARIFGVPAALGYSRDHIYRFSYRGLMGPRWHEPYEYRDTNRDLVEQADRLAGLLRLIALKHPGRDVDIISHSQGGIIARTYLEGMADAWAQGVPHVEHLVTFATPHSGSALAHLADYFRDESLTGGLLANGARWWAERGGPIPNPDSAAVRQMQTDSDLITWLASEDVAYGTRVLALAVPNDLITTADRAIMPGELSRIVPPEGASVEDASGGRFAARGSELAGRLAQPGLGALELAADAGHAFSRAVRAHGRLPDSGYARRLAYAWLGDHPDPCRTGWDSWGSSSGAFIAAAERAIASVYGAAEAFSAVRLGMAGPYWGVRAAQDLLRGKGRAPSVGGMGGDPEGALRSQMGR